MSETGKNQRVVSWGAQGGKAFQEGGSDQLHQMLLWVKKDEYSELHSD